MIDHDDGALALIDELHTMTPTERLRERARALASLVPVRDGFAGPDDIIRVQRWLTLEETTRRF